MQEFGGRPPDADPGQARAIIDGRQPVKRPAKQQLENQCVKHRAQIQALETKRRRRYTPKCKWEQRPVEKLELPCRPGQSQRRGAPATVAHLLPVCSGEAAAGMDDGRLASAFGGWTLTSARGRGSGAGSQGDLDERKKVMASQLLTLGRGAWEVAGLGVGLPLATESSSVPNCRISR
ncbi:hypothetical protein CCMA1212_006023 [Trichoderma ghanense]|uniref:Uncharacterized protein n=1 Tax=Trichoderma ghanense TaxID=65468 RepID=A0ABY2H2A0_9HYPO